MLPQFKNQQLLDTALTHRSALNEHPDISPESNERLEFLGDAVLELIATEFLFKQYPSEQEGVLTAYRSALVKTTTLAEIAEQLGLGEKLFMSKGEEATGGRTNPALLANTMEAVIGALYLDQGIEITRTFITKTLLWKVDEIISKRLYKDPKSLLQEVVQAKGMATPNYEVISEEGPDHNKQFTVGVYIDSTLAGQGLGKSKQLAQQAAATEALKEYS